MLPLLRKASILANCSAHLSDIARTCSDVTNEEVEGPWGIVCAGDCAEGPAGD